MILVDQKLIRIKKIIRRKGKKKYEKTMIILLIFGLIKKTLYKMSQYFPKPYKTFGGNINVIVALSNYATKADLKNAIGTDTSKLGSKSDLISFKGEVQKNRCRQIKNSSC